MWLCTLSWTFSLAIFGHNIFSDYLPFWYRLTRVVLEKGPLNGCMCVCVYSLKLFYVILSQNSLHRFSTGTNSVQIFLGVIFYF